MRRMSNNERLDRMAAEKAAAERERLEKAEKRKAEAAAKKSRSRSGGRAAAPAGRTRVVWALCNPMGDEVKTFLYPQKEEAEQEAARLTEEKGTRHYVVKKKEAME